MDGQGNLERTWKVREKSGNLKINGYARQSSENLFCSRGERMEILMRYTCSLSPSPSPLGSKFFTLRVTTKLTTVNTIKEKNKNDFFLSVRGYGKL